MRVPKHKTEGKKTRRKSTGANNGRTREREHRVSRKKERDTDINEKKERKKARRKRLAKERNNAFV